MTACPNPERRSGRQLKVGERQSVPRDRGSQLQTFAGTPLAVVADLHDWQRLQHIDCAVIDVPHSRLPLRP